ncbi:AP-3 complex subunit delta, partial [Spiromyces aspiralis]
QPDIGLLDVLVNPNIARYDAETQQVYVQAAMKVYALWLNAQAQEWSDEVWDSLRGVSNRLLRSVSDYISAQGLVCPAECQSRAKNLLELLKLVSTVTSNPTPAPPPILTELHAMFTSYDLNPIAPAAQAKVPVPESLDLDSWIDTPVPDTALTLFPPTPPSTSPTLADK